MRKRQTDRQTDRQSDRQTGRREDNDRKRYFQTDRQVDLGKTEEEDQGDE